MALCDQFIQKRNESETAPMRERSAAKLLSQVLDWHKARAQASMGQPKKPSSDGWSQALSFLTPFLTFAQKAVSHDSSSNDAASIQTWLKSVSPQEVEMVENAMTMTPRVEWMLASDTANSGNLKEFYPLAEDFLTVALEHSVQAKKDCQASSNVLKSSTEPLDVQI